MTMSYFKMVSIPTGWTVLQVLRVFVCALCAGMLFSACSASTAQVRAQLSLTSEFDHRLGDLVQDFETFGFSGAVLVSDSSRTLIRAGFGRIAPNKERITSSTPFDIGSLAKQFTAAAVLALQADGVLSLDDSVGKFFPTASQKVAAIRINQLLTHTSGLMRGNVTDDSELAELVPTKRDSVLARIFRSTLRFVPGTQQSYSNAGYVLLSAIIEVASGRAYPDYLRHRLFARAGLQNTLFWGEHSETPIAVGCDELGTIFDPGTAPKDNWTIQGAGGILSSIDDLDRWIRALTTGRVLPKVLVDSMMTAKVGGFGYGWRIGNEKDHAGSVFHGGDYHGFGSQLLWYPSSRRLIVILCNVRNDNDIYPTRIPVENAILGYFSGSPRPVPQVEGPVSVTKKGSPTGRYYAEDGSLFAISPSPKGTGLEFGVLNQQAINHLWPAGSDTIAYWGALNKRAASVIKAVLAGDTAGVRTALSQQDDPPYVYEQLKVEMQQLLAHHEISDIVPLGTYPAAIPKGAQWTIIELRSADTVFHYRLRWYLDVIASYHLRSPSMASPMPMGVSTSGWVAWDIVHPTSPIFLKGGRDGATLELTTPSGHVMLKKIN